MEAQQGVKRPGHCKATAQRLRRDAELIASRLAAGQTVKALAVEYGYHTHTLVKHVQAVIGRVRWRQIVRQSGPKKGAPCYHLRQAQPKLATGPECFHCGQPYTPGALKCTNCGNLFYG